MREEWEERKGEEDYMLQIYRGSEGGWRGTAG